MSELISYGFIPYDGCYVYEAPLQENGFVIKVTVTDEKIICWQVLDTVADEEYVLVHMPDATGAFVGRLRDQAESILSDIQAKCFGKHKFTQNQSSLVVEYIAKKYGHAPEFPWKDENAVFRDEKSRHWYAALLTVKGDRVGLDTEDKTEVINLKAPPEEVARIIDKNEAVPAYHMNKKHWYTVRLDGSLPIERVFQMIDESYKCVTKATER